MRNSFRPALAPLALVALTLLFFYKLAFTDLILARGDTFAYFYPYWGVRNAALLSGQLPLWSPNLFMGVPLLANSQIGTFYPPNWIVAPLAPPDGVRLSILLHVAWAGIGTYLLARRTLKVGTLPALTAALLFAFGGHIAAHVEQINQLQGLAWMPWLLYLFDRALARPLPGGIVLGIGLALQFFTGHTQTVFITGVALAIYALCTRPLRGLITLMVAGAIALLLAAPQLVPTLELAGVSNRRGGFNLNQATAFSFSPFVTGRGLLPSYDTLIFGEYVAYPGVIGLGLALVGLLTAGIGAPPLPKRRWPLSPRLTWAILALVGLALAYGIYNPVYWLLGTLPGFDLFRVPARWLALFALGTAMLAALGVERIFSWRSLRPGGSKLRLYAVIVLVIGGLAAASALTLRQNDGTPISLPTPITLGGWALALAVLLVGLWRRWPLLLAGAGLVELWLAAQAMPYNLLVPPDAYRTQSLTESQMLAYDAEQTPPQRVLSISNLLFDPGDRAALEARLAGLSKDALAVAFDAVKMKETLAANLPLQWAIPSADGFDGGLLPTAYYSAFTSLFLPPGELRTIDGRLREILAKPECGGACIPDQRWLNLMNVDYLITDKVYDVVYDGVFYDTQFTRSAMRDWVIYSLRSNFEANAVDVLLTCDSDPCPALDFDLLNVPQQEIERQEDTMFDGNHRLRITLKHPELILSQFRLHSIPDGVVVRAVSFVDLRTGDFAEVEPGEWNRVLSSDIKLYQTSGLGRAFAVSDARFVSDSDSGTEDALRLMRDPAFDPTQTVILTETGTDMVSAPPAPRPDVQITQYGDTRVSVSVNARDPAYLVLTDAYYPGWVATINGQPAPIERADVMFRAVRVPAGESQVVFEYRPAWYPSALIVGLVAWLAALLGWGISQVWISRRRS